MPTVKRCPKCNGKVVPLQIEGNITGGEWQPFRCKRCKHETRVPIKKRKRILRMGDYL